MVERTVVLTVDELWEWRNYLKDRDYRLIRTDQGQQGLIHTITYWEDCSPEVVEEIRIWRLRDGYR